MCLEPETRQNGTLSVFHPAPWMEGECQGIRKLSLRGRNFLFRGVGEREKGERPHNSRTAALSMSTATYLA